MTILHIDSSINGENSASRAITKVDRRQIAGRPMGRGSHLSRPRRQPPSAPDARRVRRHLDARRIPRRRHGRHRRADVQFHHPEPAQGVDRPHRDRRQDLPLHRERAGRAGRGKRVIIALARGGFYGEGSPAAALEHLETLSARRVQLHRHRARVRHGRRPQAQPRASRDGDRQARWARSSCWRLKPIGARPEWE